MKTLILVVLTLILFTGCESNIRTDAVVQYNGISELEPGIFVKPINMKAGTSIYHTIYVYCDKDGRIIKNTPISTHYTSGKVYKDLTLLQ